MKQTTSIRVDPDLWKAFKIYAVKREVTVSCLLERLLREELAKTTLSKAYDIKPKKREELAKNVK